MVRVPFAVVESEPRNDASTPWCPQWSSGMLAGLATNGDDVSDSISSGSGTKADPWKLKTPPLSSDYTMHRRTRDGVEVIVCTVGKTVLLYDARCLDDLHAMLQAHGDWMDLGSADEQKPAKEGTVEAWGRSESNPVGGWYGLKKGLRGRFGMYVPPLMEHLGLAEVEHNARNNRMRAI